MNDLDQELFGSADSDSDSDLTIDAQQQQQRQSTDMDIESDDDDAFDDPIFQSIMNSHEENDDNKSNANNDSILIVDDAHHPNHVPHEHVSGLTLHTNVLSDKDQARLMAQVTEKNFFKAGSQNQAMCFGQRDLIWLNWLEDLLVQSGVIAEPYCCSGWTTRMPLFDQSIMNLYFPGNGIKPHVDLARFEDGIVIVSLLSAINMDFYRALNPMSPDDPPEGNNSNNTTTSATTVAAATTTTATPNNPRRIPDFTVRLEPGSVLTIQGQARYEWEHGIKEVMEDLVDGESVKRKIRVSITLRKMRGSAWEVGGPGPGATVNGVADRSM
ncbi:hypothetical protein BGX23_000843 [Mortierella sp. AD031]|nr:hypothetical protein BGX23_000843 [Mortierella sp. AD031]